MTSNGAEQDKTLNLLFFCENFYSLSLFRLPSHIPHSRHRFFFSLFFERAVQLGKTEASGGKNENLEKLTVKRREEEKKTTRK